MSSTKRALIAVGVMALILVAAAGAYLYRLHRPLAGTSKGSAPGILDELPADAPAVAYIDVAALRKLQNSPLAAILGFTGSPQADREYSEFVRNTGFDYTRDLDRAAIAFWPTSLTLAANSAGDNPALAIASGRFDKQKIEAYALHAGGKAESRGTESLYIVPGSPTVSFAFRSPTEIAIASGRTSADLLGSSAAGHIDPSMQARIDRVAGAPIFAVVRMDNLPAAFYQNFANAPQLERIVHSIRGLSLAGQPQDNQIHLVLDAECDSMTSAAGVSTILDGFRLLGSMALADPKTRRQLQMTPEQIELLEAVVHRAQVTHQDRWVRIALDIDPAMLGSDSKQASRQPEN
ncbi:MAG TPA: hypothetical protein VMH00_13225 [Candidatus Limnocylindrales bacterium]|nr:hypothetical protein [Candidatus Limnocylindrales bacterium]